MTHLATVFINQHAPSFFALFIKQKAWNVRISCTENAYHCFFQTNNARLIDRIHDKPLKIATARY